jgi:hypothetical protein
MAPETDYISRSGEVMVKYMRVRNKLTYVNKKVVLSSGSEAGAPQPRLGDGWILFPVAIRSLLSSDILLLDTMIRMDVE